MKAFCLPLAVALVGSSSALTINGTVTGAGKDLMPIRISGWAISTSGQPIQEIVSAPIQAGKFHLEIPATDPSSRTRTSLEPNKISWPGVLDPVIVSSQAQAAELKFFTYKDGEGDYKKREALTEVALSVNGGTLFVVWVSGDTMVTTNHNLMPLKRGWNAFVIDVGRDVNITSFSGGEVAVTIPSR